MQMTLFYTMSKACKTLEMVLMFSDFNMIKM